MIALDRYELTGMEFKLERIKRKLKLKDAAEFMQVSPSYLSKFENEHIDFPKDKRAQYLFYINTYHDEEN